MWIKYTTYITLLIAILGLWYPSKERVKLWQLFLGASLILALISQIAEPIAILSILLFYYLVHNYKRIDSKWKYLPWILIFLLGICLHLHIIPGFHNLLILDKIQFTQASMPFTLYLNLDKVMTGLIIAGLTLNMASTREDWKIIFRQLAFRLPIIIVFIIILSVTLGFVKYDPKIPSHLGIWVINNLFFICLAEEVFFRGFVQESLSQLKYKYSHYMAILITAIIFGLLHYPGGGKYVLLVTVAGIFYGWVYKVTKRVEASIIAHFMLNLTHILFFTYPSLIL